MQRRSNKTLLTILYWLGGLSLGTGIAFWYLRLRSKQSTTQALLQAPQPSTTATLLAGSTVAAATITATTDTAILENHEEVVATIAAVMTHPHQNTSMATALATAVEVPTATEVEAPTATEVEAAPKPVTQQVVGNIRTLVYHHASSKHLPAEDNRRYFTSATEAEHAGYRASEV